MFPSAEKEVVPVLYKDYQKHLVEQSNLHFIVTGKVKETGQIVTAMRVVALRNPEIIVQVRYHQSPRWGQADSTYHTFQTLRS